MTDTVNFGTLNDVSKTFCFNRQSRQRNRRCAKEENLSHNHRFLREHVRTPAYNFGLPDLPVKPEQKTDKFNIIKWQCVIT